MASIIFTAFFTVADPKGSVQVTFWLWRSEPIGTNIPADVEGKVPDQGLKRQQVTCESQRCETFQNRHIYCVHKKDNLFFKRGFYNT